MQEFTSHKNTQGGRSSDSALAFDNTPRRWLGLLAIFLGVPVVIALGISVWNDRKYYLVSALILLLAMVPFFLRFEAKKLQARELVVLAVLAALGVAGRAAFYMFPQVKPIVALVILAGVAFGGEAGFLVGAVSAFVSNFFFSQGPWTPWQMFAMGVLGFLGGLLFYPQKEPAPWKLCLFGGLGTFFIYGLLLDTASLLMFSSALNIKALLAVYLSGISFNLLHAGATVVFLAILSGPLLRKITRIKEKFGLLEL